MWRVPPCLADPHLSFKCTLNPHLHSGDALLLLLSPASCLLSSFKLLPSIIQWSQILESSSEQNKAPALVELMFYPGRQTIIKKLSNAVLERDKECCG